MAEHLLPVRYCGSGTRLSNGQQEYLEVHGELS